ncbi:alpha/beta fold hydrolase [Chitinophagaceae bacterium MMS25-I14]
MTTLNVFEKNNITICGNKEAMQTIVFGHGFGTDQHAFDAMLPAFERDYRLVLFDNTGGGKSDIRAFSPERYDSLHAYVTDLADIFRELGLKDVIYIGHSVNGMISLLTSIRYPEFFKKLVLIGASPRYLNDPAQNYTGGFTQPDLDNLYQAMRTNYQAWASGFSAYVTASPDRPDVAANFAHTLSDIRPDIALSVAKVIFESDHRSDLQHCKTPALVVQTSADPAVPLAVGDYLHRHITGSTLVTVEATGHLPHMTSPAEVTRVIKEYIKQQ